ncbi:MAG TPA: bifunctional diaminohydroxyphosphoribosylaminopyrimidine deaminase/5-amino-6-(5-phosphoribosylamino)uracil reductase RibD [Candidatus Baltobacteraceae bacterium]|jgi:diaminohydroxyphosphoribosylaminopyrimidine deaminase/5-amino-6-(5-phosphoribosylamino)uracil reductase|nr:bifunctional diaminohydroxyphosphoribosylaminopyrimidine deaminase/5-amino-6-(5-phosphoribosylamino)uracil reductase RibD [Candidatus Baltobacteraceae bacterium]
MDALDRLFLARANELARRGTGNTAPNPAVGAVVTRDGRVVGEGYHHRAGEPHAEVLALRQAGELASGATLYVSLEPCNHFGRTPPCTHAVTQAGITRAVIGAADPNPTTAGGGIAYLREHGLTVEVADDPESLAIIELFARAIRSDRPFITLKMAMSLDGFVTSSRGVQQWLTGPQAREFVRELRIAHDAVGVGAGTIRVDNPRLTVRPEHHRLIPYRRVVLCETDAVDPKSLVFSPREGYGQTIVAAPAGARARFAALERVAQVLYVGEAASTELDIAQTMRDLRACGITSLLCEGGPTLAGRLFHLGLVDRFYGLVAPLLLRSAQAVPVLTEGTLPQVRGLRFDRVERVGPDLLVAGIVNV